MQTPVVEFPSLDDGERITNQMIGSLINDLRKVIAEQTSTIQATTPALVIMKISLRILVRLTWKRRQLPRDNLDLLRYCSSPLSMHVVGHHYDITHDSADCLDGGLLHIPVGRGRCRGEGLGCGLCFQSHGELQKEKKEVVPGVVAIGWNPRHGQLARILSVPINPVQVVFR
jgi:hypothetical protein